MNLKTCFQFVIMGYCVNGKIVVIKYETTKIKSFYVCLINCYWCSAVNNNENPATSLALLPSLSSSALI